MPSTLIRLEYGPRDAANQRDPENRVSLTYPAWSVETQPILAIGNRIHTADVVSGTLTQALASKANTFSLNLRYVPRFRAGPIEHWAVDIEALQHAHSFRTIEMLWGEASWGEWLFHDLVFAFGRMQYVQDTNAAQGGMYPEHVLTTLRFTKDGMVELTPSDVAG